MLNRVNQTIGLYLQKDLSFFFKNTGKQRALDYKAACNQIPNQTTNQNLPEDAPLVLKIYTDVTQSYCCGVLDSSTKLRMRLVEELCAHLGVDISTLDREVSRQVNAITHSGATHITPGQIENARIDAYRHVLGAGLQAKGYLPAKNNSCEMEEGGVELDVLRGAGCSGKRN